MSDAGRTISSDTGPWAFIPEWVLYSGVSDRAVRLYCVLRRFADEQEEAYPSRKSLAELMGCSTDSVDRACIELEEIGALDRSERRREDGGRTSNLYFVRSVDPRTPVRTAAEAPLGTAAETRNESQKDPENPPESLTLLGVEPTALTPRESRSRRARDPVFDALHDAFPGATPAQIGKARKDLRARYDLDADPFPEEITRRRAGLSILFENAPVSIMALVKWWTEAGEKAPPPAPGAEIAAITDAEWARIVDLDWPRIQDCRVCRGPAYAQTSYCEPHLAEAEAFIQRRRGTSHAG